MTLGARTPDRPRASRGDHRRRVRSMTHRLMPALAAAVACFAVAASGAAASHGPKGQFYSFSGELVAAPGANATSLSLQVETGNKPALRVLLGASDDQVLALDASTEVLIWSH